jgi:energy-coupling factor transport system ATP-binding protein
MEAAVKTADVYHTYPNGVEALKGVSLEIEAGEFVGIIGQNGSGKTTLVKHFNGLLRPTSGTVLIEGEDSRNLSNRELVQRVGYVFQNPDFQLFKLTVEDEVGFGPRNLQLSPENVNSRVREALRIMDIAELDKANPGTLDKGKRQRVAIASVLAMRPNILVIDEPTTGQAPAKARQIMDEARRFNELKHTVIVISHDMKLIAEYVQRVIILMDGRVVFDGDVRDAFSRDDILARTHLEAPQITRLSRRLGLGTLLTVDEALAALLAERENVA